MMSNKRVIYSIELGVLILAMLLYATYYNIRKSDEQERWLNHTREVLQHTGMLLSATKESELQARNYMITGQREFISAFRTAQLETDVELRAVKKLVADNAAQVVLLDSLEIYLAKRKELSARIIDTRTRVGEKASISLAQRPGIDLISDRVRRYLKLIENNENILLASRQRSSVRATKIMNGNLLVTVAFFGGVLSYLLYRNRIHAAKRRRLLADLVQTNNLMLNAEKLASFGTWTVNLADNTVSGSEEMYRIWGLPERGEKPIAITGLLEMVHPDDREFMLSWAGSLLNTNGSDRFRFRIVTPGGEIKYTQNGVIINRDANGKVLGIQGYIQDITEKKLAEDDAVSSRSLYKQSEANLRTIVDNTNISYVLMDTSYKVVSFNKPAELYSHRFNNKELHHGQSMVSYFPENKRRDIKKTLETVKKQGYVSYEYRVTDPADGSEKWFGTQWVNVRDNDGQHSGYILTNTDITELKLARMEKEKIIAELIVRNRTLEEFTYIVSHNLRLPVANIIGLGDLLQYIDKEKPEWDGVIQDIIVSVNKLDEIVIDLNAVLQAREQVNQTRERVNMHKLLAEIEADIKRALPEKTVQINHDLSAVSTLFTVRSYLYQILYNLLLNSIKFSHQDRSPVISVQTRLNKNFVKLIISDNGKGIDLEKYGSALFGLYRRFDVSVEGKGVGLFMVKTYAEALGGMVDVESSLNEGSVFSVSIPAEEEKEAVLVGVRRK